MKLVICILCVFVIVFAKSKQYQSTCGYQACPKIDPDRLNVHIVPHSHDDVGWLKTVDQYYYGTRNDIQHAGVQYILDSVIQALLLHPERRFIQVETAFFWQWWQEQCDLVREEVRGLINEGRLEVIGGAWSMNDEATVHYQSTIDQFTWGFRKLLETLGKCAKPKVGWQIDPFGHSREQASLFAQMGFDGLFFARLDYRDKELRLATRNAEFLWQGSPNLGRSSRLFTHVLYNHYMTPPGFCFDVMCPDTPIVDNERSPEYNSRRKAREFLDYVINQSRHYKTNNVIVTMGGDFHYQDALSYFINIDKLMIAMREEDPTINVFYSTPSCYLKAVNEANETLTVKTDDFFPYASDAHSYWTGYYTSRPTSKRMEREANNLLQVTKQLSAGAFFRSFASTSKLNPLREAMGVMQHHDAITGTEKQHVADDYGRMLHEAMEISLQQASTSLRAFTGLTNAVYKSCLWLNISQCEPTEENNKFLVTVYNPLSRPVDHYVRLPVPATGYRVFDASFREIEIQVVPIFAAILIMPGRKSTATHELVFKAKQIPPLGTRVFYVEYVPGYKQITRPFNNKYNIKLGRNIKDRVVSFSFNERVEVFPELAYYLGESGEHPRQGFERASGAYIFRPHGRKPIPIINSETSQENIGPHVFEQYVQHNEWAGQIIRLYEDANYVEYQWIIGPIPEPINTDAHGKEVIVRYSTDLKTRGVFYTDSNGREMLRRIRDYRADFNLTNEEPVSRNYYPVTTKITLLDVNNNTQFSVLNDRPQGGSSIDDGVIELMVHRRLFKDDGFGVAEELNEIAYGTGLIATGKHYITAGPKNVQRGQSQSANERLLAKQLHLSPWLFITPLADNFNRKFGNFIRLEKSILTGKLPRNVHILTLEPWDDNAILLRLEHIFEYNEDNILSQPVKIHLEHLFSQFRLQEIREMNLGANELASDVQRLQWRATDDIFHVKNVDVTYYSFTNQNDEFTVTLSPMEIKTFLISVS